MGPGYEPRAQREPLVLTGHGIRLRIDRGCLYIRNGFTHYPQERQEFRFFPGDWRLPSRIILLDPDGSVSLDVLRWLGERDIPLVILDWQGKIVTTSGGFGAYDPQLRQAQIEALHNGKGEAVARQLIRDKLRNSVETLFTLWRSPRRHKAVSVHQQLLGKLEESRRSMTLGELRLLEAQAAGNYFGCWQEVPISWRGVARDPIPSEWYRAGLRQSLLSSNNRHATHPINAMLNYAYAVLETEVRKAIVESGLDPAIGYLHVRQPGRLSLVYDLMEPLRPKVDRLILDFALSEKLSAGDFQVNSRGECRLHPQLARVIVSQAGKCGLSEPTVIANELCHEILYECQRPSAAVRPSSSPTRCG